MRWLVVTSFLGACAQPVGRSESALGGSHVLFVDFDGAHVTSGSSDDATMSISALGSSSYPAFDPSIGAPTVDATDVRDVVLDRVRSYYLPYDLQVTGTRPSSGAYASVLVGGTSASLVPAQASGLAGIAPLDCTDDDASSLGFAFAQSLAPDFGGLVVLGATIAHEAGHGYGLEHVANTRDPMYSVAQPAQTIDDVFQLAFGTGDYSSFVAGGGAQPERCGRADPLDNDAILAATLGRTTTPVASAPSIDLVFPPERATMPTTLPVEVAVGGDLGVVRVEVYRDFELVAVLTTPPYTTTLTLAPAASVYLTVEAVTEGARRALVQRSFAVSADAPAACDDATPCASPQACVDHACVAPAVIDAGATDLAIPATMSASGCDLGGGASATSLALLVTGLWLAGRWSRSREA